MSAGSSVVQLNYGRGEVNVQLETPPLHVCAPRHVAGLTSPEEALRAAVRAPIGSPSLQHLAQGRRSAAILISARDRVTRSDLFTGILADELNAAGIPDEAIQVVLATGTHQKQTPADIESLLGPAFGRLRVVHHDPRDEQNLIHLGTTRAGTPISVNRGVYETDLKILTGRIAHHYFAGFSGGRKAIAPGVAGMPTILANHKRVMSPDGRGRHPGVAAGVLTGNPVHEDLIEIARPVGPTFCVNTVLNTAHELTHVFAGDWVAAHEAGCGLVDTLFRVPVAVPADVVVASCGGWPYDLSFMQVVKTIVSASHAVADGGTLVVLGACERGLEPGFLHWSQYTSLAELNRAVLAHYDLKGHNTFWLREIQSRIRVVLVSTLGTSDVAAMGFVPASTPAEGLARAYESCGPEASVIVVPYGNIVACARVDYAPPSVGVPVRAS